MQHSSRDLRRKRACVVGAGPNGLAAAIVLAQAGLEVDVFEAEAQSGGAARTMELTLPGFHHDFGSAVHPMAAGSPFFSSLPLREFGLEWIHSLAPLAHPLDDGTAVVLERNFDDAEAALNADGSGDGRAWRDLMEPLAKRWWELADDILQPMLKVPRHPFLLARFSQDAVPSATFVARRRFRGERTRALFAGLAAHSFLSLDVAAERVVWHGDGNHRARGRMADSTRWIAVHRKRFVGAIHPPWRPDCRIVSRGELGASREIRRYDVRCHAAAVSAHRGR